ncbi:MAG: NADH-quinone oxidoreductase subunit NuoN [Pseudomonadota bacterium]
MDAFNWLILSPIKPEMFLGVLGLLLLMLGDFRGASSASFIMTAVLASLVVAMGLVYKADLSVTDTVGGMVIADSFSSWLKLMLLGGLFASLALSVSWLKENHMLKFEYPLLVLFSGIGALLMVSAVNLLSLYVSLELSSLCLYVLAAIRRDHLQSTEAGLKYFILGAISSGLLLFGISLVYGYIGSIGYAEIGNALLSKELPSVGAIIGAVFILAGLSFKISAVPFHMWTPDVYQGAPTPVTALFAIVPKVAAFGLIIRLLTGPFLPIHHELVQIVLFIAVASMAWGAFAGLVQNNIKRLLAYSSIANMGYAALGLLSGQADGVAAIIIYLSIYMVTLAGVFAVLMSLRQKGEALENIPDFAGLSKTSPFAAYILAGLMFSMSGIPPMAGFFGKLFVLQSAVAAGYVGVAIFGVLASVVGSYYYLRLIKVMFFDDAKEDVPAATCCTTRNVVAAISIAFILLLTVWPNGLLAEAQNAAQSLFHVSP